MIEVKNEVEKAVVTNVDVEVKKITVNKVLKKVPVDYETQKEKITDKRVDVEVEVQKVVEKPVVVEQLVHNIIYKDVTKYINVPIIEEKIEETITKVDRIIEVPVIQEKIIEVKSLVEKVDHQEKISVVNKIIEIAVEDMVENTINKDRPIENPVYTDKFETVVRTRDVPVDKMVKVPVIREVAVEREVVVDKVSEVLVRDTKFIDMPITIETPIHSTKWVEVERIVEKIVRESSGVAVSEESCISQAQFVNVWNKLMQIPYAPNKFTEDCIDEHAFMKLISSNLTSNYKAF